MFKINTSKETLAESSGSKFINKSGVYDIKINFASINVAKTGSQSIVFNITADGNNQTIYGPTFENKDGKQIEHAVRLYTTLGVIAGMENGEEFEIETETHNVGKDSKPQEFDVIQQFSDLNVKIQLQESYSIYPPGSGNINSRLEIKAFFAEDGSSAEELVNNTNRGKRLALVEEKYASNVQYKDGLTAEEVAQWKADGYGKGKASPTPKKTAAKTSNFFQKKT